MESLPIPVTRPCVFTMYPENKIRKNTHGYVVHAMGEYFDRKALKWIKRKDKNGNWRDRYYNPTTGLFNSLSLEEYPQKIRFDQWIELSGFGVNNFIEPDGTLTLGASRENATYHAGTSKWKEWTGLSGKFIGTELIVKGEHSYAEFLDIINNTDWVTNEQYRTLAWDVVESIKEFNFPLENVVGHIDVSGDEVRGEGKGKEDPGDGFDWNRLFELVKTNL